MAGEGQKPELKPAHDVFIKKIRDLLAGHQGEQHTPREYFVESVRLVLQLMCKCVIPESEIQNVINALADIKGLLEGKLAEIKEYPQAKMMYLELDHTIENLKNRW